MIVLVTMNIFQGLKDNLELITLDYSYLGKHLRYIASINAKLDLVQINMQIPDCSFYDVELD